MSNFGVIGDGNSGWYFAADGDYRLRLNGADVLTISASGITSLIPRAAETMIVPIGVNAEPGATAGWVVTGVDSPQARLPASQTDATLVVEIPGLNVGDVVTAFAVCGQIESAGNAVTIVASLRKLTSVAAENTDAEIGTDTVAAAVADTLLSAANLGATLETAETLAATEKLALLITGTTAGATDIALTHALITVRRAAG